LWASQYARVVGFEAGVKSTTPAGHPENCAESPLDRTLFAKLVRDQEPAGSVLGRRVAIVITLLVIERARPSSRTASRSRAWQLWPNYLAT
jgi:hypothetical protein